MTRMTIKYIILLILLVVIILLIIIAFSRKKQIPYYKHPLKKIGQIQEDIFNKYNFKETSNWKLYIPQTYNTIEEELLTVTISGDNKFIFGINGCDTFVSKNGLWSILLDKYGSELAGKLIPRSYLLYNQADIDLFRKEYIPNKPYIMKKNIQRKQGLKLTSNIAEILEGGQHGYKVVQEYMDNIFLVNSRKLNIRIYILVICDTSNDIQFYLYNRGKCIYTNKEYNGDIYDMESNITSYKMDIAVYDKSPFTTDELDIYIKTAFKNKHPRVMDNIKDLMKRVCIPIKNKIFKSANLENSTTFQLFGCDIILDDNLNPFILEFNKGPEMKPKFKRDYDLKYKLNTDMYNLVGLINSRTNYFNRIC